MIDEYHNILTELFRVEKSWASLENISRFQAKIMCLSATSILLASFSGCFHDCTVSALVVIVIRFHHLVDGILVISYVGISTIFTGLFCVATSIDKLPRPGVVGAEKGGWRVTGGEYMYRTRY